MACQTSQDGIQYMHQVRAGPSQASYGVEMAQALLSPTTHGLARDIRAVLRKHGYDQLTPECTKAVAHLVGPVAAK
jgi:hypothetical protein